MRVIFLKDVKKQGKKGEIKEVTDGYATFLINNKDAVSATEGSVKRLQKENALKKLEENLEIKECENIKKEIEKLIIKIPVRTGENDRIFGSISTKQITLELKKKKFDIDKKKIHLDHEITSLGFHNVSINLHKKVEAKLRIEVVKER